ncbi:hypothetical protein B9479_007428 [Cryptococcus floricola]|uniref:Translation machinery-associated protein 16 n=1 Tax=Cryptococcus floricola TaxID=2591691 RepID=A0A5D3API7_9TREE|nr:hypothetical protein B9479_007428 [Cryptococcus floricola]
MGNRRLTKKAIKGKEGLHPGSRKAHQLTRVNLRLDKLQSQGKIRKDLNTSKMTRPLFFLHSLSSPNPLTLESFRALVSEVYLKRNDPRIDELLAERRAGRPKQKELLELEEFRRRERSEWDSGMELPDMTHGPTTHLMHQWIMADASINSSHLDLMRHVRLSPKGEPVMTKKGSTEEMGLDKLEGEVGAGDDWTTLAGGEKGEGEAMEEEL